MIYQFIDRHKDEFPVNLLCETLMIKKSAYYAYKRRPPSARQQANEHLLEAVKSAHKASMQTYGSPRITAELNEQGITCGHNRVARIMRENQIRAITAKKFRATTDSNHSLRISPNLLKRQFCADGPNKIWVGDITYIYTQQKWLYLATVMDTYNREIIGWTLADSMEAGLVISALKKALLNREVKPGLIFHSDRGSQYASDRFRDLLQKHHIKQSMSRKGDCWDNAMMESFYKTLKCELIYPFPYFETINEAKASLFYYIEIFYNRVRKHSALNYKAPVKYLNYQNVA